MATLRLVPGSGSPIEVDKDSAQVGREPSCDVVVADGSVSRRHARIEKRGATWFVVDQGSANGTFVDSQRTAEAELRGGQELRFGAVSFKVEIEGDELGATVAMPSPVTAPAARPAPPPPPPPPPAPVARPVPPPPLPPPAPVARPVPAAAAVAPPPPPPAPRAPAAPMARTPVRPMGVPPQPPKKGKGPMFWILMGCCGCLLLSAMGGGGFFASIYFATQPPVEAVRAMLNDLKSGQTDAAYERLSQGYRSRLSREEFEFFVNLHPGLKDNKDSTFMKRSRENNRTKLDSGVLTSNSGLPEVVTFELVQEDGKWKIDDMRFGEGGAAPPTSGPEGGSFPAAGSPATGGLSVFAAHFEKRREEGASPSIKIEVHIGVTGYKTRERPGGDYAIDLNEDVETRNPSGERIDSLSKDGIERYQGATSSKDPPAHVFQTTLTVDPGNPPGTYTVRATVHDMIGGGKGSHEVTFELP
jgi:hypothetical protein